MVHVDANFLIDVLKPKTASGRALARWAEKREPIHISAVAWAEFLCGRTVPQSASEARAFLDAVDPLTEQDAELASVLFNNTGRRSRSLADCFIAAHAIRRNAALATLSVRDFRLFENFGLKLAQ